MFSPPRIGPATYDRGNNRSEVTVMRYPGRSDHRTTRTLAGGRGGPGEAVFVCDGSGVEGWNNRTLGSVGFGMQGNEGGWL
jgi:hypothetical protein